MTKIADLFYENVKKNPAKEALWCDGITKTYQELGDMVSNYSNMLLSCGVQYGDHIGIPMNNSVESVAIILAAANLGLALVPINPTLPLNAMKTSFACGDVKHIIARRAFFMQEEEQGKLPVTGVRFCMDGTYEGTYSLLDAQNYGTERPTINQVTGNESFIITMTSGSTGEPKPINLTQENKLQRALAHRRMYNITEDDRILAATPLYHSLAERLVLMPLLFDATSILLPRFTPNLWLQCVNEQQVTFTIAVSAQLNQIADLLSSPFMPEISSLRCIVSSSALLETHVKNNLIDKLKCDFHEMYGTSETSTVTDINFAEAKDKKKSVGKPFPEAKVRILSEDKKDLPFYEIGEIACASKLMCDGYYKKEDIFQKALYDGYFCTGDLGYLDEDGYLYFSGRKKEIIITGGINVFPQDVEEVILKLPEVEECAVFSYPSDRLGEVVAAAIVVKKESVLTKRKVQMQCAKNLADYQQPHEVFFLDALPRNAMGKIVKGKLPEAVRLQGEQHD